MARPGPERPRPGVPDRYGLSFEVVGLANRRDGFVYREDGIDAGAALAQAAAGNSLRELEGVGLWPAALDGLRATEADVLVETSASPAPSGEPGRAHLAHALERGIPAVTSNKWPLALHGLELIELARSRSTSSAGGIDGDVGHAGRARAHRRPRRREADFPARGAQRDGELHPHRDRRRQQLRGCPRGGATRGPRGARSERRRRRPRRGRQADDPGVAGARAPAHARAGRSSRDLIGDRGSDRAGEVGRAADPRARNPGSLGRRNRRPRGSSRSRSAPTIRWPASTAPTTR